MLCHTGYICEAFPKQEGGRAKKLRCLGIQCSPVNAETQACTPWRFEEEQRQAIQARHLR